MNYISKKIYLKILIKKNESLAIKIEMNNSVCVEARTS